MTQLDKFVIPGGVIAFIFTAYQMVRYTNVFFDAVLFEIRDTKKDVMFCCLVWVQIIWSAFALTLILHKI
jgi:hypothetical protein